MRAFVDGFDWDEGNRAKCERHGVSVTEIENLFHGEVRVTPDLKHSAVEVRYIAVGRNATGRALFVAFTLRTEGNGRLIRPISARYMHAKEVERFDAQGS